MKSGSNGRENLKRIQFPRTFTSILRVLDCQICSSGDKPELDNSIIFSVVDLCTPSSLTLRRARTELSEKSSKAVDLFINEKAD